MVDRRPPTFRLEPRPPFAGFFVRRQLPSAGREPEPHGMKVNQSDTVAFSPLAPIRHGIASLGCWSFNWASASPCEAVIQHWTLTYESSGWECVQSPDRAVSIVTRLPPGQVGTA